MFDIREYYNCSGNVQQGIESEILEIDSDLVSDIDTLVSGNHGDLYVTDRYKTQGHTIDIIHPSLWYPGNQSLIMTPDRLRFLLSFYPYKDDLVRVDKIVLRPRYIEAGNIELAALYMKRKRILVIYLTHPAGRADGGSDGGKFVSVNLENIMDMKIIGDSIDRKNGGGRVPLLWNVLSVINPGGDGESDKFFIRRDRFSNREYVSLNDISYFYYRHGY